jgi:signal transduction histidine kinase/CheY-like chemotaxis protein
MLRQLREPMLIVSPSGLIHAANVAAAEALGAPVVALEGQSLAAHSPDAARLPEWLKGEAPFPLSTADGRRFFCDARVLSPELLLLRLSGGTDSQARVRRLFDTLAGAGGNPSAHFADPLRALLVDGMAGVGAFAGGLHVLDPSGQFLELKLSVGYPDDRVELFRALPMTTTLPLIDAVKQDLPIFLGSEPDFQGRYAPYAQTRPRAIRSAIACVPLRLDGRVIGGLGLGFPMPWTFTDADRGCIERMAHRCVLALNNRFSEVAPAADQLASRLEMMQGFAGSLAGVLEGADAVEIILEMVMAMMSARSAGLWLVDEGGATATLARTIGPTGPRAEDNVRVPLDAPFRLPALDVMRTATPLWFEKCEQLKENYPDVFRAFSRGGEAALAVVPLLAAGRCHGALVLIYDTTHAFTQEEQAFLKVLAWHSGQALERARLYSNEQQARREADSRGRRSDFMSEASVSLAASLDAGQIVAAVAAAAVPRIADWCIVELADGSVRPVVAHRDPAKEPTVRKLSQLYREITGGERGVPKVIRTGKSVFHRSSGIPQRAGADGPILDELGLASLMIVPIVGRDKTLGAFVLSGANGERFYDEKDLALAEDLGRRVGLALDNARLYAEARQADRLKDEFLAMLSHELRNPLAPIVTTLSLMEKRATPALAPDVAKVSRHVRYLVRLVDDLLDVARITRGRIELQKTRCDVWSIIEDALEMARPLLAERGHRLTATAPLADLAVLGDRARLTQVVANLLNNAAKYTPRGGQVDVSATVQGGEGVIRVGDSGIGLSGQTLPRVFDLFYQASTSLDRAQGGLGIGLTLVKGLVALHDGSVTAHSEGEGRGSEFVVRLPLAAEATVAAVAPQVGARPVAQGLRVLVVDDNMEAASSVVDALEVLGCAARMVHDGISALREVGDFDPDLALLDIGLPEMDGYELARRLRGQGVSARLVALTGYGQESDRQRSQEAGFDEHVMKPIDLPALEGILSRVQ